MSLLIRNGYVVTMNAARDVFDDGWVLVDDAGRIDSVGPGTQLPPPSGGQEIDATGMIVVPGLIDAQHYHWQNLLMAAVPAGAVADLHTLRAFAGRHMDDAAHAASARIAAHTLLRGGTTCVLNQLHGGAGDSATAITIDVFAASGMQQVHAIEVRAKADVRAEMARLSAQVQRWHGAHDGRIRVALEVPTSAVATQRGEASEEATSAAHRLACERKLRIVTRTSAADGGGAAAYHAALQAQGRSEVMHLMELGVLDDHWLLAGGELLNATDISLMRESGCAAVYTPLAEAGRGLGWGPWAALRRAGVFCALGTGLLAQHAGADMVEQMKACIMIQNTVHLDATAMGAEAVLEMATIDAARALGLDDEIGSLEPGKRADIAVFDLRGVQMQVCHKPVSVFVACAGGVDAAWVIANGRVAVARGCVEPALVAQAWVDSGRLHAQTLRDAWNATAAGRG